MTISFEKAKANQDSGELKLLEIEEEIENKGVEERHDFYLRAAKGTLEEYNGGAANLIEYRDEVESVEGIGFIFEIRGSGEFYMISFRRKNEHREFYKGLNEAPDYNKDPDHFIMHLTRCGIKALTSPASIKRLSSDNIIEFSD